MKEISKAILLCIKAERESEAAYFRLRPKLKDLALEEGGKHPLEKAAFTLHYFYIDNDNDVKIHFWHYESFISTSCPIGFRRIRKNS